jgi:hypothetical protein
VINPARRAKLREARSKRRSAVQFALQTPGSCASLLGDMVRRFGLLGGFACCVLWAPQASAYCRQHSCQDEFDTHGNPTYECARDEQGCIIEGNELFYSSPCLSYGIAKGTGQNLGVSDKTLNQIVKSAFARWKAVDCGKGKHPSFDMQSVGVVATDEPSYCRVTDLNLGVWFLDPTWPKKLDVSALGYTTSTYAQDDAEVFDADVEINAAKVKQDFAGAPIEDVLLSIVTHEAGHVLGLAHSNDADAVMATSYGRFDLIGRELTQDDIDGVCSIYPPGDEPTCSAAGVSEAALDPDACNDAFVEEVESRNQEQSGCALAPRGTAPNGSQSAALGMGLGLLGTWAARRRTRRQSGC